MTFVLLAVGSAFAWFISTLAGGGSPLIMIPLLSSVLGSEAIPPVITFNVLVGSLQRTWSLWRYIDWQVTLWFMPGTIVGAILGAYTLTQLNLEWLQIFVGLFLIYSLFSFGCGKKERSFNVELWHFLPSSFLLAFISGIIGSTGPVVNVFFLNYGLVKEDMIATKSFNVVMLNLIKIIAYINLGVLKPEYVGYGLLISVAAIPGNWLGELVLEKMSAKQFRTVVLSVMLISGMFMIWDQRQYAAMGWKAIDNAYQYAQHLTSNNSDRSFVELQAQENQSFPSLATDVVTYVTDG